MIIIFSMAGCSQPSEDVAQAPIPELPVKNMVTLVDLGSNACKPCVMMAPILEELKGEYKGRAEVVFIDVWKNPEEAKKFKVMAIPTQIFFDRSGKEVQRHIGFFDKKSISAVLENLL